MPVFQLIEQPVFPPPEMAEPNGLLAVGGDLSSRRLLLAYSTGLFPWFNEGDPILWWSPDPRCVLFPSELHVSRRLERTLSQGRFRVTLNRDFGGVIEACAHSPRARQEGTWITDGMIEAYLRLHEAGYAHSLETWEEGDLAGGIYGVALGRCFFGESMFHRRTDASKVALVHLVRALGRQGYELLDCQMPSPHLASLGAREIPRSEFLHRLRKAGITPSTMPRPGFLGFDLKGRE